MKKIFTFCCVDFPVCISASSNRHAFIPTLQEFFIGWANSLKSVSWGLITSLLIVKYKIPGRINNDKIDHKYEFK